VTTQSVSPINAAWYLVHCQQKKEHYAALMLKQRFNLATFLPEYTQRTRGQVTSRLLFPGYIFAQANLQEVPMSQINTTPGVLRLVNFGAGPEVVPDCVVEEIANKSLQVNAADLQQFRPGDHVRLKHSGSLHGLTMVFAGSSSSSQRVRVLLEFLGNIREVQVHVEKLEKV
jgi:transcriptional antiterminator RfaH